MSGEPMRAPSPRAALPPARDDRISSRQQLLRIEDRIFTEWRLRLYGSGIVVAWIFVMAWQFFHGRWLVHLDGTLASLDFCWMWVSGKLAVARQVLSDGAFIWGHDRYFRPNECIYLMPAPTDMSTADPGVGGASAERAIIDKGLAEYPPTELFLTLPLGWFDSYFVAFAAWVGASLLFYEIAIYSIIPRWPALIVALGPVPVLVNALNGHNGFVTAGLIGVALVLVERQPWLCGIFLGFLTFKPHFGVLFPFALVASRNWRALAGAAIASVAFGTAAAAVFGMKGWMIFFTVLFDRGSDLSTNGVYLRFQSVYGMLRWVGAKPWISFPIQIIVSAVVAAMVCIVWAKPAPHALKAAILCVGAIAVTPYVLGYDLPVLSIGVAFLVKDGLSRGFLPGERLTILACFAALFLLLAWTPPPTPIVCALLLVLAGRRLVSLPSQTQAAPVEIGCATSSPA